MWQGSLARKLRKSFRKRLKPLPIADQSRVKAVQDGGVVLEPLLNEENLEVRDDVIPDNTSAINDIPLALPPPVDAAQIPVSHDEELDRVL